MTRDLSSIASWLLAAACAGCVATGSPRDGAGSAPDAGLAEVRPSGELPVAFDATPEGPDLVAADVGDIDLDRDAGDERADDPRKPEDSTTVPDPANEDAGAGSDDGGQDPGDLPPDGPPPWTGDAVEHPFEATGFFRVDLQPDRWWLVTPDGKPFYSVGVNHVQPSGERDRVTGRSPYGEAVAARYPDREAWAEATAERLRSWGFNTIGAWSDVGLFRERMPYTVILYLSGADWLTGEVPDYFAPEFEDRCAAIAAREVAPRREDPGLLGWFLDNEMHWGPDWRTSRTLLEDYLSLPEGSPGRAVAERHAGDPSGFLLEAASRFFEVTTRAVRAADPNHLVLGSRFVSVMTPPEVVAAAGPFVDVVSVNYYAYVEGLTEAVQEAFAPLVPVEGWLRAFADLSGRPVLITEFSFRAADSGLPNSWPPVYPVLDTQADRANAFEDYATRSQQSPWIVGHHWFQYFDEPPNGRFDGEDSNFGLVDNDDRPWEELTARMARVHEAAPGGDAAAGH